MMRGSDIAATVVTTMFGAVTGWLLAGTVGAAVGVVVGSCFGIIAGRANVRPAITMTVFVGSMAGVLIGASIVETICLPDSCVAIEATAGVVVGLASLIGVGLVAALVTRSFDEYNENVAAGTPPPTPGCEAEPDDDVSDGQSP
jgi:hypothetical protein